MEAASVVPSPQCQRRLCREFTGRVDDVQDDDRVGKHFHENDKRELVDDKFAGVRYAVAFPDPFRERWQAFYLLDDPPFYGTGDARPSLDVVVGEYFLEIVERLVGPDDPHAYAVLRASLASSRAFSVAIASACSRRPVSPESTRRRG